MSAKEAESLNIVSVGNKAGFLPMDLPPAYDDVANLKVKLEPVHQKEAAINLPSDKV
jgi:hypothetical protein